MFIVVCFCLLFLLSGDEAAIDAWARSKKLQGSREHLTREWMYETGYRPERPG